MITMPNLVLGNVQQWISFYIHHHANSLIVVYSVLEYFIHFQSQTLCEKCPNTELFLVHAFFQVEWILRIRFVFTSYLSVFTLNAGKYGPEITPYLGTFHAVMRIERHNMILLHCQKLIELVCLTFRIFSNIFEDESTTSLFLNETNFYIIKYKVKVQ